MTLTYKRIAGSLLGACALFLSACGGGGGGGDGEASRPSSYWSMDGYVYVNGGHSATTTTPRDSAGNVIQLTATSTATVSGGDSSNGSYSGSAVNFMYYPLGAGTYTVVSSREVLVATPPTSRAIFVETTVGVATTSGSTQYQSRSGGSVSISVDSAGSYHFATPSPLLMGKHLEVGGGIVGAPASMELSLFDVY